MLKINSKILLIMLIFLQFSFVCSEEIFLSLKKSKVNVRYGPGFDFPVKFVYRKTNFPVKQIDKKENFRRVIDVKNNSGWIHVSQLKKVNSVIVLKDKVLFKKSSFFSKPVAKIKKGRLLIIKTCEDNWCKVKTDNLKGWVNKDNLWGFIN
jgi:SH3-like domain-containing protein